MTEKVLPYFSQKSSFSMGRRELGFALRLDLICGERDWTKVSEFNGTPRKFFENKYVNVYIETFMLKFWKSLTAQDLKKT